MTIFNNMYLKKGIMKLARVIILSTMFSIALIYLNICDFDINN